MSLVHKDRLLGISDGQQLPVSISCWNVHKTLYLTALILNL